MPALKRILISSLIALQKAGYCGRQSATKSDLSLNWKASFIKRAIGLSIKKKIKKISNLPVSFLNSHPRLRLKLVEFTHKIGLYKLIKSLYHLVDKPPTAPEINIGMLSLRARQFDAAIEAEELKKSIQKDKI